VIRLERTRPGGLAREMACACLIAAVAILAITAHGDLTAPPRYDGAGYTVLARSLGQGHGYRAIDHPDRPRHTHFPPGYPVSLALLWETTGYSTVAAHVASCVCTLAATLAAWWWFRRLYGRHVALVLGLALAVNWVWARTGSAIQSEPLYEMLGQFTILAAIGSASKGGLGRAIVLGGLMAACLLTRHVAIALVLAVLLDHLIRRRRSSAVTAAVVTLLLIAPWVGWLLFVGGEHRTQASLVLQAGSDALARAAAQSVFYIQRLPDQITGPLVEIATIVPRSRQVVMAANLWALLATGVIVVGWLGVVGRRSQRTAGGALTLAPGILLFWPYTEAGRFLVPLIPCLLIGALEALTYLARLGAPLVGLNISARRIARTAAVLILIGSLPYSTYSALMGRSRARDAGSRGLDLACSWLTEHGKRPGPVLTRHPGEVYLQTGRQALEVSTSERRGDADASPEAIDGLIDRYNVAYLLIDQERYTHAPPSPLNRFALERPGRVRKIWGSDNGSAGVAIYEVLPHSMRASP
jgi:hypothetical protein